MCCIWSKQVNIFLIFKLYEVNRFLISLSEIQHFYFQVFIVISTFKYFILCLLNLFYFENPNKAVQCTVCKFLSLSILTCRSILYKLWFCRVCGCNRQDFCIVFANGYIIVKELSSLCIENKQGLRKLVCKKKKSFKKILNMLY